MKGWQANLKRRRAWAIRLLEGCRTVAEDVQKLDKEIGVVRRGANIAVENVQQHVGNLEPKYQDSKTWADQICEDQSFLLANWQKALKVLGSVSTYESLGHCLSGVRLGLRMERSGKSTATEITLRDLLDLEDIKKAASLGEDLSRRFADRIADLGNTFDAIVINTDETSGKFQQSVNLLDSDAGNQAERLMEEIEVIAKKLNADYEHVLGLPDNTKSLSQISKTALLHKSNFMPSLIQISDEISQLLTQTFEQKRRAMASSAQYLQKISILESSVSSIHSKLANLDIDSKNEQVFDVLNFVMRLPSTYGFLLVECVKRQEWAEKMTVDSSSLVEEIATYKDEETRRRRKWGKDMAGAVNLGSLDEMALGIEVNVHSQKQRWPKVDRKDVTELIQRLRELGDLDGAAKEIEDHFKTLDAPSKQQARRTKAFKNGSVHEATYGKTSLLLRGDDEALLAMRNEKSRIEEKLKSAESRVRKLEDLLHRQSQSGTFSRLSSAAGAPTINSPSFERHVTTPVTNFSSALTKAREIGSRRSSIASRRFSMNNDPEGLAQRIVSLEVELNNEKAQSAELARKAEQKANAEDLLKSQVREAISTKEDLLGNLEAQQHEFDDERRLLIEKNNNLTIKLEEVEDEFDRALDSRVHEDRIHALEEELEQARAGGEKETQRALNRINVLQNDYTMQLERANDSERENLRQREENAELGGKVDQLSSQLDRHDQRQVEHHRALRTTLLQLSPDGNTPEDFGTLVEAVENIVEKSAAHLKDIQSALDTLREDNSALESRVKSQDDEVYDLRERLGGEEREVFSVREALRLQRTQFDTLQKQLDFERHEHNELKIEFASGETDSAALQSQLTEKESIVVNLLSKITSHEAQRQQLEERLEERGRDLEMTSKRCESLDTVRAAHVSRSANIARRLILQNQSLEKLIEHIGLVVSREDDTMIIQKAPRATGNSTVLIDPSASMRRSSSEPLPTTGDLEPSIASELLHWADPEDLKTMEERFAGFMNEATQFDTDVFSEAVYKRVKDIEHIARKWQKEARAYRDKSHRAQTEAHDRIALRNFKEGDLALFLPTRDQATKPWAAFNVGAPHCFLREQESHGLARRDWLIARISKVEERVVDLSKSMNGGLKGSGDQKSISDKSDSGSFSNNENPYELSDGLRWYLIDAAEEKPGAPISVGTGKVTVASANVDAKGSIRMKKTSSANGATKTLTRSLDSRRSSTNSKKGLVAVASNSPVPAAGLEGMLEQSIDNAAAAAAATSIVQIAKDKDVPQARDADRPQSSQRMEVPASRGQDADDVGSFQ